MHPKAVDLFKAIDENNYEAVKQFINTLPNAVWLLNQGRQTIVHSAFDYALSLSRTQTINIFLDKLSYDANIGARSTESQLAFQYALVKATKHFCYPIKNWDDLKIFYENPEAKFSFLIDTKKDWITWGYHVASSSSAAYNAVTEMAYIKPEIQGYIRAHAIALAFSSVISENQPGLGALLNLRANISVWKDRKIFSQHSNWLSSWVKPTKSIETLDILREACDYLISHRGNIADDLSVVMALKIMLLCAKAYSFSSTPNQKEYWLNLAISILRYHHTSPTNTHKMYEPLLDKQWLRTDNNIPLVDSLLIDQLSSEHIAHYLRGYEQNTLADKLVSVGAVNLHPGLGNGTELMGLFPLPNPRKCFVVESALDDGAKKYLHLLLMNNNSISLSYVTTDLLQINPLRLFPYAPKRVYIDIADGRQLAHLAAQAEINSHTHQHIGFALPRKLILEQGTLSCLHDAQKNLGSEQTVTILVLDNLQNRRIDADMVLSRNEIAVGPQMRAETAKAPLAFYELYQKLNWSLCPAATTVESQLDIIRSALGKNQPLMFIFNKDHFDSDFLVKAQELLKEQEQTYPGAVCLVRFDNLDAQATKQQPMIIDCDVIITDRLTKPGPLCLAALCNRPELYLNATMKSLQRPSVAPKITSVDEDLSSKHHVSHDSHSDRP